MPVKQQADVSTAELWEAMTRFGATVRGRVMAACQEIDLTPPQAMALKELDPGTPLSMGELASRMQCDASNITGIVDRLEARGLVERQPSTTDRRVKVLAPTKAGVRTREQFVRRIGQPPPGFDRLSASERRTLYDLLAKLTG